VHNGKDRLDPERLRNFFAWPATEQRRQGRCCRVR